MTRVFRYRDELERAMREVRRQRVTPGSKGQPRLSPLVDYVVKLEAQIGRLEAELGMTPLARARLGLTIGQAAHTLDDLNAGLDLQGAPDVDPRLLKNVGPPGTWEAADVDAS